MLIAKQIAIVGGGFSGTLLAINLLRHGDARVTLIERNGDRLARGLAFGAAREDHVLNVRAANMSALPDEPDHFVKWLKAEDAGKGASFATRRTYGRYLRALLDAAERDAGSRLRLVRDEANDIILSGSHATVHLRSGAHLAADMAVIAPGNLPPHDLHAFAALDHPAYVDDPWAAKLPAGLQKDDSVLLLGSGLTAVDCALSLDAACFTGRILAVSRRGLLPHAHEATKPGALRDRPAGSASALVRMVRERARAVGWRAAVDELRPFTQDMWRAADAAERARFLRHLRPYWDVHRHRLAPVVAERLENMQRSGRLKICAAKVTSAQAQADLITVGLRPRGTVQVEAHSFARIINCTGPLGDLRRAQDPLLRSLWTKGAIRPDPLAIGIDVDRQCRAMDAEGAPQDRLRVVGPMTRGAHWEIVAVPDIRHQVWTLARDLSHARRIEASVV